MAADGPLPRHDPLCDIISGNSGLRACRLTVWDIWALQTPDDASANNLDQLTDAGAAQIAAGPFAFSYWRRSVNRRIEDPLAISVVKPHPEAPEVGIVACLLSRHVKRDMVKVVNAFRRMLDAVPFRELCSTVAVDYDQGHRLVRVLGYRAVRTLTRHSPSGENHILYARVKAPQ